MLQGALNVLKVVLSLSENEKVLVITDEKKKEIGQTFCEASEKLGASAKIYIIPEKLRPLKELPKELSALIPNNDVIVNAFEGFAEETPFRIKLIKAEIATTARVGHAPGITKEMMLGAMGADYQKIAENVDAVIKKFKNAEEVHITAPSGTDIVLNIAGRAFESDVKIKPSTFGNLPAGEIWCAPVEDKANGILVCDGSIGDLGRVKNKLRIEVRGGKIAALESEDRALVDRVRELTSIDDEASVIGELGIGLNPKAKLSGILLEDEKAGGTAHIAFGNNENMPGGRNKSKTHRDFLFYKPTFEVRDKSGEKKIIIKDGTISF
ncbi:MAG: aminopeptidase [Candidatus Thermoplasmatota archaeon]|nr:aminopeptidase [Candidatus Thermoplasmatota archaeon]